MIGCMIDNCLALNVEVTNYLIVTWHQIGGALEMNPKMFIPDSEWQATS